MSTPTIHRLPPALEAAAGRIKQTARQAVERTIESLSLAALSAGSVSQRSEILAAQFELDRKSAMFILAFDQAFEDRLRKDVSPRDSGFGAGPSNWAELSLVDDHEVEIKVAAERFGLQMAHACEWELRELSGYLGALLARERVEQDQNPLRPELIGLAMIRAAEQISEREEIRRMLVTECCRSLGDTLGPTYAAVVADFRALGLQPSGLTVRQVEGRTEGRRSGDTSGHGDLHDGAGTTGSGVGFPSSAPGGLRQGGTVSLGQVEAGMMNVIRRLAVVDASAMRSSGVGGPYDTGSGGLVAANLIRHHREELRAASRGNVDHLVIDVIGSLFDQILSDPKVPPQIARQIARLQLPVLRAALGDPSFFSSRRHPVRRLVNRIASLGAGIEDFSSERGQKLVARVRDLVQEIVEGDFEQVETYESKLTALEAFVAELARADLVTPQGDAAVLLQRKEDELRLQQMYAQQLQSELRKLSTPAFLNEFVSTVWSRVLLRCAQTGGVTAERTVRMRRVANDLLMSVQPKATPQARKQFLADLPKLMQALNEGLDLIAWPDDKRRSFFGQLLPAHAEALKSIAVRALDYNLLSKQVEAAIDRPMPTAETLKSAPLGELPVLSEEVLLAPFDAAEAKGVGMLKESAVDWNGKVDIDLSAEPEVTEVDIRIDGLAAQPEAPEPSRGKSLADHVQLGFAYRMNMQGQWHKVRLAHVSPARTFYVFTYGDKQRQTVSMTHRMLVRMCDSGRMLAFENAYLLERATARARKQLAALTTPRRSA